MSKPRSKRRISNLKLTIKYRNQYLGRWIAVAFIQLVLLDGFIYWVYHHLWSNFQPGVKNPGGVSTPYLYVGGSMLAATLLLSAAILVLALLTAHRIGGPYIALKRTCRAIRDGELGKRLHFRDYDRLDDVQADFNQMIDALEARIDAAEQPAPVLQVVGDEFGYRPPNPFGASDNESIGLTVQNEQPDPVT